MTDEEFVRRILEAERQHDSDFLAWRVEEIAKEYRDAKE